MTESPPLTNACHWHIAGTGSMACLWAAYLSAAGHRVSLIPRHDHGCEAYHGITLETASGKQNHAVELESAATQQISRLLVCTKAYDLLAALKVLAPRLDQDARVVLLQNGMGFQDQALAAIAPAQLFCALTTEGAHCPARFHVRHAGRGLTLLGRYDRSDPAGAQALAAALPHALLDIRAVADIVPQLWRKLAISGAINALTALHGCRNGGLLDEPVVHAQFLALCAEISTIMAASGHAPLAATVLNDATQVALATASNRSSMLQDVDARRRTEIDFINGHLCRCAARAGVACPLNQKLCDGVHALEQSWA